MKTKTIDLKGKAYAQVKDRLKEFLEANPSGKHESSYETQADGSTVFTVWLWKDKAELLDLIKAGIANKEVLRASADGNGNAKGEAGKKEKDFEKLETIALGRALANIGYLSSGEIASSEEMEEFQAHQAQKKEEMLFASQEKLEECEGLDELKTAWAALPVEAKAALADLKEKMKVKLTPKPKSVTKRTAISPVIGADEIANFNRRQDSEAEAA